MLEKSCPKRRAVIFHAGSNNSGRVSGRNFSESNEKQLFCVQKSIHFETAKACEKLSICDVSITMVRGIDAVGSTKEVPKCGVRLAVMRSVQRKEVF